MRPFTAVLSVSAAACLWRLLPNLRKRSRQSELREANRRLHDEIQARAEVEIALRASRSELEDRVAEQTLELSTVKATLQKIIEEERYGINLLRTRDKHIENAFDAARVGTWRWEIDSGALTWDRQIKNLYGLGPESSVTQVDQFFSMLHPDDRSDVALALENALNGISDYNVEFRVIHPDGSAHWICGRGALLLGADGKPVGMAGINMDIADRKEAEIALLESERQFATLAETIPQLAWIAGPDGNVVWFNRRWYDYTNTTPEQNMGWGWVPVIHPDDLQTCIDSWENALRTGQEYQVQYRLKRGSDGLYHWHLGRALPFRNKAGEVVKWFGTCTDIHLEKTENERLEAEVQSRTEDLRRSLTEKELLLKEVHHRVKNNLQVISSLLRMQGRTLSDPVACAALKESEQRVQSMALIHEQLYGRPKMDEIDFEEYTSTLVSELFRSYASTTGNVVSRLETSCVLLSIDQAIPCGLILNEVVTNALKYAYPDGSPGEILVRLKENAAGAFTLSVSDNGVGMPAGLNWKNSKSLGLPMVDLLAQQLDGTLTVQPQPGVIVTLKFPIAGRSNGESS